MGVVASGNLEVLMVPAQSTLGQVHITTKFDGNGVIWQAILERFFAEHPVAADIEINDFGATPGVVFLRLLQALEASGYEKE